jgi:hypothetical protein
MDVDAPNPLWANRLVADSGLLAGQRVTWTTFNPFHPGAPLLPSGLIGPVILRSGAPAQ